MGFAGAGIRPALAANRIVDLNSFQQQDMRAMAMGNAFSAIARGETALQYNPAGLAQYDFDLKVEGSLTYMQETGNFLPDTLKVTSSSSSQQDVLNYLTKYDGTTHNYVLQAFPSAVANLGTFNFGIGAGQLDVQRYQVQFIEANPGTIDPVNDSVAVTEDRATIGMGGLGFKFFSGKALLGVTMKNVRYSESSSGNLKYKTLLLNNKIDFALVDTQFSPVTAYDVGFIYRVEWLPALKPQWSVTGYNVGGFTMTGTPPGGTATTVTVPDTYNFGFSMQPDIGFLHILISADYEDLGASIKVLNSSGSLVARSNDQLVHGGIELGLFKTPTGNNWLSVRAGTNGGYASYGAEINLGGFLRAVYTNAEENIVRFGQLQHFKFEGYQVGVGIAW